MNLKGLLMRFLDKIRPVTKKEREHLARVCDEAERRVELRAAKKPKKNGGTPVVPNGAH